jgi:hypothetical protein
MVCIHAAAADTVAMTAAWPNWSVIRALVERAPFRRPAFLDADASQRRVRRMHVTYDARVRACARGAGWETEPDDGRVIGVGWGAIPRLMAGVAAAAGSGAASLVEGVRAATTPNNAPKAATLLTVAATFSPRARRAGRCRPSPAIAPPHRPCLVSV